MKLYVKEYWEYLQAAYERIHAAEDYITDLDLATGDGDHWANLDKGFSTICSKREEWGELNFSQLFSKIGMTMMSVIGGSSGVLYGGAYLRAAKEVGDKECLDLPTFFSVLRAMLTDMMERGKAQRGWKTMIDALAPAVDAVQQGISAERTETDILRNMMEAAIQGAESTKDMPAVKGRATYQANKGVGNLDPGAVTMAYQLEELGKVALHTLDREGAGDGK